MSIKGDIPRNYILDLSGKFLFMRHGQSLFNKIKEESRKHNPELIDAHLSEDGINQAKSKQEELNKLDIEKVYVSPFYRALETMIYSLQNHPKKDKIIAIVNPKLSEVVSTVHDFIFDIKQNKKQFNMNSSIKVDWSYFDEYIKHSEYDENFFYFENMNLLDEKRKKEEYLKLKSLYEKGNLNEYRFEIGEFVKQNKNIYRRFESFKHANERFNELKLYLNQEFKETINDNEKKILCISHSSFIKAATSSVPFLKDQMEDNMDNFYSIQHTEIISLLI